MTALLLAMIAEFESDLIRLRTRKGMKIVKAKGWLKGSRAWCVREKEV